MDGWTLAPSSTSGGRPKLNTYRPVSIPGTFQDVLGSGFKGVAWYRLSLNLNKAWEPVAQKMYQAAQKEAEAQAATDGADVNTDSSDSASKAANEEEVEDADFEVVEDKI